MQERKGNKWVACVQVGGSHMSADWVYLKLFKDIDVADVDMLLPGSVVKFSWLDHIMIWAPILFGLGSAAHKSATGTLVFTDYQTTLTSVLMVILPLTW